MMTIIAFAGGGILLGIGSIFGVAYALVENENAKVDQ